ncbi:HipA N-terminal domain-containing protein [Microbacterium sp.]|uniref:HipA N-terminal domain-containing protein n=1 Tax=Microbacterium sp. TaxID=51671 RepID=UPI0039E42BEE
MSTRELHVFIDGVFVGELRQSVSGAVAFAYDESYRRRVDATPLSLSMPVTRATHPQRAVLPFLQGLLPDSAGRLEIPRERDVGERIAAAIERRAKERGWIE